jgi:hypothetical protein
MKTKKKAAKKAVKKVAPKAVAEPIEEVTPDVPAVLVKASPQEVMVISLANNPRYVYASLDGTKIAVEVPAWMSPRLIKKTITVIKKLDSENYEIFTDGN